jgi:hypothetical protein
MTLVRAAGCAVYTLPLYVMSRDPLAMRYVIVSLCTMS